MKNESQIITDELRKLITKSCNQYNTAEKHFDNFHKSLFKFYFGVADVAIDTDAKVITFLSSRARNNTKLYQLTGMDTVTINYSNLEETLKGCIESGEKQMRFYKSLLFHYNNVEDDLNSLSA